MRYGDTGRRYLGQCRRPVILLSRLPVARTLWSAAGPAAPAYGWVPAYPEDLDLPRLAEQALTEALETVFGAERPARLRTRVLEGYAGQILVEASAGAELLVVGSRGYGGFVDALLGSVSTYCVHHARCPVTVIRAADHHRGAPD